MRTMTTRAETALVVPYYSNGTASSSDDPMPTLPTRDRMAIVVPSGGTWNETPTSSDEPLATMTTREGYGLAFIAELRGGGSKARHVREPLATVTAAGNHHMLVRHNTARGNPGQMCTPATEPARTITTAGHQSLVGWPEDAPDVDDCTFRMLEPHEIQAAMAFHGDYRVLGNRRERVKQLGNAVTPPAAEFLLAAVVAALDGAA
jgi:DNA (cytosine-5)-methyltransferase 1